MSLSLTFNFTPFIFKLPFDFAQGDRQTERSRSLFFKLNDIK